MTPGRPRAWGRTPLVQPDGRSCGAAVAVVARALATTPTDQPLVSDVRAFATDVLTTHRDLTSTRDPRGGRQLPWPGALGTPPWALAHHLEVSSGLRHDVLWARTTRVRAFARATRALAAGHPVGLYLGNARLPRHVVLALPPAYGPSSPTRWAVYEPAYGVTRTIGAAEFTSGRIADCAWPVPWFVVVPRLSRPAPR